MGLDDFFIFKKTFRVGCVSLNEFGSEINPDNVDRSCKDGCSGPSGTEHNNCFTSRSFLSQDFNKSYRISDNAANEEDAFRAFLR